MTNLIHRVALYKSEKDIFHLELMKTNVGHTCSVLHVEPQTEQQPYITYQIKYFTNREYRSSIL